MMDCITDVSDGAFSVGAADESVSGEAAVVATVACATAEKLTVSNAATGVAMLAATPDLPLMMAGVFVSSSGKGAASVR